MALFTIIYISITNIYSIYRIILYYSLFPRKWGGGGRMQCPSSDGLKNITYQHNGILGDNKNAMKYWCILQCGWTWKHYAKWNQSVIKDHISYDSIHMKYPEQASLWR